MTAQTVSDLSTAIDEDLGWRRKELVLYRAMVENAIAERRQAVLRGAIAVLYAHWEGFLKHAAREYIAFVAVRRLKLSELSPGFLALAARAKMTLLTETSKTTLHVRFFEWLFESWSRRVPITAKEPELLRGNVDGESFREIRALIGIHREEYSLAETTTINRLVRLRNNLAHGAWERVQADDFADLYAKTDKLLGWIRDDIESAAINKIYVRTDAII